MRWFSFSKPTVGVIQLGAFLRLYPVLVEDLPSLRITYMNKPFLLNLRIRFCPIVRVSFRPGLIVPSIYLILLTMAIIYFCCFLIFCEHLVADIYVTGLVLCGALVSFPSQIQWILDIGNPGIGNFP